MALAAVRSASTTRQPRQRRQGGQTQQSLKSAQTRARLIDATIRCIVKMGYANTTTPQVATEATDLASVPAPPTSITWSAPRPPVSFITSSSQSGVRL